MKPIEIVRTAVEALEKGDFEKAHRYLSENLRFSGPVPEPIGREEFEGVMRALLAGIPDWRFNGRDLREEGGKVKLTVSITGTNSRELPPVFPGLKSTPPTGRKVHLPEEHLEFTLKEDKIERIEADRVPGGGVLGVLKQLGVSLPEGLEKAA